MKKFLLATAFALALVTPSFAAETYKIEPSHTSVVWQISHLGFSIYTGKFNKADGTVTLDEKQPKNSKVEVTISIADNATGDTKLNEHLAKPDFFDTAKFPTATFKSTKVEPTGKNTAKVTGDLTLHGVTKPVTLNVKLNKIGDNFDKVKTAGFSATSTIKRSDFGMTTYLPNLGDEVKLQIDSEANLETPTTKKD